MSREIHPRRPNLPSPETKAYFPTIAKQPHNWKEWAMKKAGENNLIAAIGYGSQVTGDASLSSIYDFILIVRDTAEFHKINMINHPEDYGHPRSRRWHNLLNSGPNYYQTEIRVDGENSVRAKYAVISEDNFIKGCGGSLPRRRRSWEGRFGFTVAGRMQKVALNPIFIKEDQKDVIEAAINKARIDGTWMTLGTLGSPFTLDQFLSDYTSLSYRADVRIEKAGKNEILVKSSKDDYKAMMSPIFDAFEDAGIISRQDDVGTEWKKIKSPTRGEIYRRTRLLRFGAVGRNYVKNLITGGLMKGIRYATEKTSRANTR